MYWLKMKGEEKFSSWRIDNYSVDQKARLIMGQRLRKDNSLEDFLVPLENVLYINQAQDKDEIDTSAIK